jgi:hypothetical protein
VFIAPIVHKYVQTSIVMPRERAVIDMTGRLPNATGIVLGRIAVASGRPRSYLADQATIWPEGFDPDQRDQRGIVENGT